MNVFPVQTLLDDFVFADCRLADHPEVAAAVCRLEDGGIRYVAGTGFAKELTGRYRPKIEGMVGRAIRERSVVRILDTYSSPLFDQPHSFSLNGPLRALLAIPILQREFSVGAVLLLASRKGLLGEERLGIALLLGAIIAFLWAKQDNTPLYRKEFEALISALRQIKASVLPQATGISDEDPKSVALHRSSFTGLSPEELMHCLRYLGILTKRPTIVHLMDIGPELMNLLASDPGLLRELSPAQFELLVADRLEAMGYKIALTGSLNSRDGGVDIIAVPPILGTIVAVQVKHHRSGRRSRRPEVDQLLALRDRGFQAAMLVTNTTFTREAMWASSNPSTRGFLRLRDFRDVARWVKGNFWVPEEWRELPSEIEIAPGRIIRVPMPRIADPKGVWHLEEIMINDSQYLQGGGE